MKNIQRKWGTNSPHKLRIVWLDYSTNPLHEDFLQLENYNIKVNAMQYQFQAMLSKGNKKKAGGFGMYLHSKQKVFELILTPQVVYWIQSCFNFKPIPPCDLRSNKKGRIKILNLAPQTN